MSHPSQPNGVAAAKLVPDRAIAKADQVGFFPRRSVRGRIVLPRIFKQSIEPLLDLIGAGFLRL
jgi:hypothetical protein